MGMTEQAEAFRNARKVSLDESLDPRERILSLCDWGIMSKDTRTMAQALREISDLAEELE